MDRNIFRGGVGGNQKMRQGRPFDPTRATPYPARLPARWPETGGGGGGFSRADFASVLPRVLILIGGAAAPRIRLFSRLSTGWEIMFDPCLFIFLREKGNLILSGRQNR